MGTPKSSILRGVSIINHPFLGPPFFGNTHVSFGNEFFVTHPQVDKWVKHSLKLRLPPCWKMKIPIGIAYFQALC